jgi:hypothetical protein
MTLGVSGIVQRPGVLDAEPESALAVSESGGDVEQSVPQRLVLGLGQVRRVRTRCGQWVATYRRGLRACDPALS